MLMKYEIIRNAINWNADKNSARKKSVRKHQDWLPTDLPPISQPLSTPLLSTTPPRPLFSHSQDIML